VSNLRNIVELQTDWKGDAQHADLYMESIKKQKKPMDAEQRQMGITMQIYILFASNSIFTRTKLPHSFTSRPFP
jgi:hypothetical protein